MYGKAERAAMAAAGVKPCTRCREVKPFGEFGKKRAASDGLQSACKDCSREKARIYYENNREKVRERSRIYYENNREKMRERSRIYRENNPEKTCEAGRRRRAQRDIEKKKLVDAMGGECVRCGPVEFLSMLEFHHVHPEKKLYEISILLKSGLEADEPVVATEANKCAVLCGNCHEALRHGDWSAHFVKRRFGWGLAPGSVILMNGTRSLRAADKGVLRDDRDNGHSSHVLQSAGQAAARPPVHL